MGALISPYHDLVYKRLHGAIRIFLKMGKKAWKVIIKMEKSRGYGFAFMRMAAKRVRKDIKGDRRKF